eukprot:3737913-Rhodomonas_salina.1
MSGLASRVNTRVTDPGSASQLLCSSTRLVASGPSPRKHGVQIRFPRGLCGEQPWHTTWEPPTPDY